MIEARELIPIILILLLFWLAALVSKPITAIKVIDRIWQIIHEESGPRFFRVFKEVVGLANSLVHWYAGYNSRISRESEREFFRNYRTPGQIYDTFWRLLSFYVIYTGILTAITLPVALENGQITKLDFITERIIAYQLLFGLIIWNVALDMVSLGYTMRHLWMARRSPTPASCAYYLFRDVIFACAFFILAQLVSNGLYPMTVSMEYRSFWSSMLNFEEFTLARYALVWDTQPDAPVFLGFTFPGQLLISGTTLGPTIIVLIAVLFIIFTQVFIFILIIFTAQLVRIGRWVKRRVSMIMTETMTRLGRLTYLVWFRLLTPFRRMMRWLYGKSDQIMIGMLASMIFSIIGYCVNIILTLLGMQKLIEAFMPTALAG